MAEPNDSVLGDGAEALEDQAPKKSKLFLFGMLGMMFIAGGGGAFVAFSSYVNVTGAASVMGLDLAPKQEAASAAPIEFGEFTEITGLVINPKGSDGARYLMVGIGLEGDALALEQINTKQVVIRDLILRQLSLHTVDELAEIDLRDAIKDTLRTRVNTVLQETQVSRLYFTQYVLQ